jgi:membrane protease YdiL (CAAX protease family)
MRTQVIDRTKIVNITLVLEAVLLLAAVVWMQLAQVSLIGQFSFNRVKLFLGVITGMILAASGFFIFLIGKFSGGSIKWIDSLKRIVEEEIAPMFRQLRFYDIVLLALSSGFCEEVFFRGVMQSQIGLMPTSFIFGLFHCPNERHLVYGLWALGAGLVLGLLSERTGSLWVPILAHTISNFVSILYMRYWIKPIASGA